MWLFITLGIIAFILLAALAVAIKMHYQVMFPNVHSYEEIWKREIENKTIDEEWYNSLDVEKVDLQSDLGYKLTGEFYDIGSKDTVIICHGYTINIKGSIKYMKMFIDKGFNVLIYDHRNHGHSDKRITTFGYYEKKDLKQWVTWVKKRKSGLVGTHGESMGAATVLQHAAIDDRVDFVIADCPFSNVRAQFAHNFWQDHKIPPYTMLFWASFVNKIAGSGFYNEIRPIHTINDFDAPVMFIHGESDTFVPTYHSIDMYKKRKDNKKLHLVPGAAHAKAYQTNMLEYTKQVHEFLDDYIKKES